MNRVDRKGIWTMKMMLNRLGIVFWDIVNTGEGLEILRPSSHGSTAVERFAYKT